MSWFVERLNRSSVLSNLINFFSRRLAHYRGAPLVFGVALTVVSLIVNLIAIATGSALWQAAGSVALHVALFSGLLGVLLAEPLGRG